METKQFIPLSKSNIGSIIGKKIQWIAEGYNRPYQGIDIIRYVDYSKHNPIISDCISGDDLRFAFLDNHGLISKNGGQTYQATRHDFCFSYSDSYHEIFFAICE